MRLCIYVFVMGLMALGPRPASADEPKDDDGVIELDTLVIESSIQKPNAFYILERARLGYQVMDLRTSFLDEIIRSVHQDPF